MQTPTKKTTQYLEQNKSNGIHILADFFFCKTESNLLENAKELEYFSVQVIQKANLTIVGKLFHQFNSAGVTGVVLLAESHLAIHTWPEREYLTLDIFVCNLTKDNSNNALFVYENFYNKFQPKRVNKQEIIRE